MRNWRGTKMIKKALGEIISKLAQITDCDGEKKNAYAIDPLAKMVISYLEDEAKAFEKLEGAVTMLIGTDAGQEKLEVEEKGLLETTKQTLRSVREIMPLLSICPFVPYRQIEREYNMLSDNQRELYSNAVCQKKKIEALYDFISSYTTRNPYVYKQGEKVDLLKSNEQEAIEYLKRKIAELKIKNPAKPIELEQLYDLGILKHTSLSERLAIQDLVDKASKELDIEQSQKTKADAGKDPLTLVPMPIVHAIAKVRDFGVKKYGVIDSWKKVAPQRYKDAAFRHWSAYLENPNAVDDESGLPHLYHCACNIAFLIALEGNEND